MCGVISESRVLDFFIEKTPENDGNHELDIEIDGQDCDRPFPKMPWRAI